MAKKLSEVIDGDFRYDDYKEETQRWLRKIDVLNKRTPEGEKVKLEDIEKLIIKLQTKYKIQMQWITLTILEEERPWYAVSIKSNEKHEYLKTVYGLTLYELMCKVVLFMYAYTRGKDKNEK